MLLRKKTIDELFDLEEDLHQLIESECDGSLYKIISVYEALYRKINAERGNEFESSLLYIKKKLIFYLIRYGTYLKTQYRKDDYSAEESLEKALMYDRKNPIAHYRLGFLRYKQRLYFFAIHHFQAALRYHEQDKHADYSLTDQQLYNAQLALANSALYIAEEARQKLLELEQTANRDHAPQMETSPLYEMIEQNEDDLQANAFKLVMPDGERTCSREVCDNLAFSEELPDTIILYFSDSRHLLIYDGKDVELTINQAEINGQGSLLHAIAIGSLLLSASVSEKVKNERMLRNELQWMDQGDDDTCLWGRRIFNPRRKRNRTSIKGMG